MKRTNSVGGMLKRLGSRGGHDDAGSIASSGAGEVGKLKRRNSVIKAVKHMGQVPFNFKYEIVIEYVDKLSYAGEIVVVWERGKSYKTTRPCQVNPTTKRATVNEVLAKELTLFKLSADEQIFNDKVYKIAVRARSAKGDTIGKIHLNFAEYAGVPSSTRKVAANLSNGAVIVAKINATFLGSGRKKGPGSVTTGSQVGSELDSLTEQDMDGIEDDFDDLLDEDEKGEYPYAKHTRTAEEEDEINEAVDNLATKFGDSPADAASNKRKDKTKLARRQSVDLSTGTSSKLQQTEQLEKEVAVLRRKLAEATKRIKDLSAQNSKLMEDLAAEEQYDGLGRNSSTHSRSGNLGSKATLQAIVQENKQLKDKLDEVTEILGREPEVEEMVRELKELKMTVAIANLEKDQAVLETAQLRKELQNACSPQGPNATQNKGKLFGQYRFW